MKLVITACIFLVTMGFAGPNEFKPADVAKYLPEDCVILDCGAHNGLTSRFLARAFPKATVLAVEADPTVFCKLRRCTRAYKRIRAFHYALCDKNGSIGFYMNLNKRRHSHQGCIYPRSDDRSAWRIPLRNEPVDVPAITLDKLCEDKGIEAVHLMHLDMQGGEYVMLKESKKILDTTNVIFTEVLFKNVYEGAPQYPQLKELLEDRGFKQIELYHYDNMGDALFIRESLL